MSPKESVKISIRFFFVSFSEKIHDEKIWAKIFYLQQNSKGHFLFFTERLKKKMTDQKWKFSTDVRRVSWNFADEKSRRHSLNKVRREKWNIKYWQISTKALKLVWKEHDTRFEDTKDNWERASSISNRETIDERAKDRTTLRSDRFLQPFRFVDRLFDNELLLPHKFDNFLLFDCRQARGLDK